MHFDSGRISGIMDVKHKFHKKEITNFDYEKEMEQALSTIFRNLRGIEEIRFRITSNKADVGHEMLQESSSSERTFIESRRNVSDRLVQIVGKEKAGPQMLQGSSSKQICIESRQDLSDPLRLQEHKKDEENDGNMKCKRRLPVVPQARGLRQ